MKLNYKRLLLLLLLVCLNVGSFTMVASAASKLSTPVVTVSNVASTGKIKVSWKTVKKAVSYKVYRSTDKKKWTCISTTKKKSITNTSPVAGKTYYYKVRAIASKSSRNSNYSKIKSIMCDLPRPNISTSTVYDSGKNKITWKAISRAVSYEIHRSTNAKTWGKLGTTKNVSWTDTSGKPGVKYYYKVKAIASNKNANSAFSTSLYRYCDLARPVVTLSDDEETGKTVVSWNVVSGAINYQVETSTNKTTWTKIATTKETALLHSDAARGVKYYYRVKAYCNVSSSASAYSLIKDRICGPEPVVAPEPKPEPEPEPVPGPDDVPDDIPDEEPVTDLTYYVSNSVIILYEEKNNSSPNVTVPYMARVDFLEAVGTGNKWYKVLYEDKEYYVWIENFSDKFTSEKSKFSYTANNKYQQAIIDKAVEIAVKWDTAYMLGASEGTQNANGEYEFDCSGFVTYVINGVMQKEIPVYRLSPSVTKLSKTNIIYNAGYPGEFAAKDILLEDIQPGDIIIWSLESTNDHSGIYLGNGEFAHSSNSLSDVCIMPLKGMYLDKLTMVRRVIPEEVIPANQVVTIEPATVGSGACGTYSTLGNTNKIGTVKKGTEVTVIFNGNGVDSSSQAYVKIPDINEPVFIYSNNLKKQEE